MPRGRSSNAVWRRSLGYRVRCTLLTPGCTPSMLCTVILLRGSQSVASVCCHCWTLSISYQELVCADVQHSLVQINCSSSYSRV